MQNQTAQVIEYGDLKNAVKTIDSEIETLQILKNWLL